LYSWIHSPGENENRHFIPKISSRVGLPLSSRKRHGHYWLPTSLTVSKTDLKAERRARAGSCACVRSSEPPAYRSRTCCISGGVQGPRVGHISVTNGRDSVLQPVRPSATRPFPRRSSSFYSRGSPVSLSVPLLLSARRWHQPPGESVGCGQAGAGGSLEVSLTILRNFADSLARVDHVRPALRSHGSGRERGKTGFRVGAKVLKPGKREGERTAGGGGGGGESRARPRRGRRAPEEGGGWFHHGVPRYAYVTGRADWKRDRCRATSQNILSPPALSLRPPPALPREGSRRYDSPGDRSG